MRRMLVVLNADAGAVRDLGPARLRDTVHDALVSHDMDVEVRVLQGEALTAAIRAAPAEGFHTVVVGAGDGTVSFAASVFAHTPTVLGVLPLGTMNMLAHDIGLPRDLPGALAALHVARPRRVDVGLLNGRAFHGVSGLGFFSQMAMERERLRESRGRIVGWLLALVKAAWRSGRFAIEIEIDGRRQPLHAYAVLVTVNAFDAPGWRRSRMDGGHLEVMVAEDRGTLAKLRVGADVLTEAWRDNPGIHTFAADTVTIHARRHRAWVATDGEVTREPLPLTYRVAPGALSLLMPPGGRHEATARPEMTQDIPPPRRAAGR